MAALGAWVGPAPVLWTALYGAVAGGVMALVVGATSGYLRQAFSNIGGLLFLWSTQGLRRVTGTHPRAGKGAAAAVRAAHRRGAGHDIMATLNRRRRWASDRGAELIEMAVVLPLLMLLMFGIIDFGFMFQRYVVLTNAAMEGARVGILPGYGFRETPRRGPRRTPTTGGIPAGR